MTLSTQNKLLLWFSTFASIISIGFLIGFIFMLLRLDIIALPIFQNATLSYIFLEKNPLYVLLPFLLFSLFVPIVGFTIYFTFEKTKSFEVLYFIAMLIGFFAQSFLLCIPIFSLHTGYTLFLASISGIAFFGKIQVTLSILFQGVLINQDESRDSDKFIGIISIVALSFAAIIPLDLTNIKNDFLPTYGFENIFTTIQIVFTFIAFLSMLLSTMSKKSLDYRKASIAFLALCIGYSILLYTSNLLLLIIGFSFFAVGSIVFLKQLHRYYMWK